MLLDSVVEMDLALVASGPLLQQSQLAQVTTIVILANLNLNSCQNTAVVCSSLALPSNGFITYAIDTTSPFDYQTTATYGCNPGFGLSNEDRVRTCVSSATGPGEWNGTAPACEGIHK